jgi:hypothetical protein
MIPRIVIQNDASNELKQAAGKNFMLMVITFLMMQDKCIKRNVYA